MLLSRAMGTIEEAEKSRCAFLGDFLAAVQIAGAGAGTGSGQGYSPAALDQGSGDRGREKLSLEPATFLQSEPLPSVFLGLSAEPGSKKSVNVLFRQMKE